MKKFFLFLLILFLSIQNAYSQTLNGEVSFDWITKSQIERDANIQKIKNIAFYDNLVTNYGKKFFRNIYQDKLKDKNYLDNYNQISQGKKEDGFKNYCGFYWKKYLIAYGIQYKKNPSENFYYDARGNLKWVDKYSEDYPYYPYMTYQYNRDGVLKNVYYFNSSYDQYIFDNKGNFKGRWYKDKMYDRNAKVIMMRTNWDETSVEDED